MRVEYRFTPNFARVVESTCVKIVLKSENRSITVEYPEAAIIDLLSRYSSYDKIEPMLMAIFGKGKKETLLIFNTAINYWIGVGVLEAVRV